MGDERLVVRPATLPSRHTDCVSYVLIPSFTVTPTSLFVLLQYYPLTIRYHFLNLK